MDKINALITLLDDPDEEVFTSVEKEMMKHSIDIIPELEKAWGNTKDVNYQLRIENLIRSLQFADIKTRFKTWINSPDANLFYGAYLVSRYQYPKLNFDIVLEWLNKLLKEVWLELNNNLTALEKVRILNHILFDVHGFSSNDGNFMAPQNSYISDVFETRKGNPVSLSIIYSVIAQNLGMPIYGVNLPKNFILAYLDENLQPSTLNPEDISSALFYINPINSGAIFGQNDIMVFIHRQKLEPRFSYFLPCSNQDIILRMLNNLLYSYTDLGNKEKAMEIRELMSLFP